MGNTLQLTSAEDASVNFVLDNGQECRYVRRTADYIIVYLSSHNGCNQACRFCHLTQTGQTDMVPASILEMEQQVVRVLTYYKEQVIAGKEPVAKTIHFNWMARGEPLLNPSITGEWKILSLSLRRIASGISLSLGVEAEDLQVKFNISTIMPKTELLDFFTRSMQNIAPQLIPTIYYSLYSTDPSFRRRWLPKAADVESSLGKLRMFQENGGKIVLHWAFIRMQNDTVEEIDKIGDLIYKYEIKARFNLVRYNPFSHAQGQESYEEVIQARFEQMKRYMTVPGSRIVPRVGFDVSASCGMFVPKNIIPIQPELTNASRCTNPSTSEQGDV